MSKRPDSIDELAPIRARLRARRVGSAKCRIRLAIQLEEKRIGGPLPAGLVLQEVYRRLEPHWSAMGYRADEFPSERQLRYALTGH